jgi:hypothetical protein
MIRRHVTGRCGTLGGIARPVLAKPISFRRSPTSIHTQLQAALSGSTLTAFRACAPNPSDESIVVVSSHHSRRGYEYGLTFAHEIARRRFDE